MRSQRVPETKKNGAKGCDSEGSFVGKKERLRPDPLTRALAREIWERDQGQALAMSDVVRDL